jgi:hypothetical protein
MSFLAIAKMPLITERDSDGLIIFVLQLLLVRNFPVLDKANNDPSLTFLVDAVRIIADPHAGSNEIVLEEFGGAPRNGLPSSFR